MIAITYSNKNSEIREVFDPIRSLGLPEAGLSPLFSVHLSLT
jgi:hypothetical protein